MFSSLNMIWDRGNGLPKNANGNSSWCFIANHKKTKN